jgi:biopolymer transport protein ExbD
MIPLSLGVSCAGVLLCVGSYVAYGQEFPHVREPYLELRLPKDRSCCGVPDYALIDSVRVTLRDGRRWVGDREVRTDDELVMVIGTRLRGREVPIGIDALKDAPWRELVRVIGLCKQHGFEDVVLAAPREFEVPR